MSNINDDIIIFGKSKEEHDENLLKVFERLSSAGLTINKDKREFSKTELKFFGLHFSNKGVAMDKDKREALLNAKSPKSAGEVRSLLGLANYCSRFIPNFATVVEPLRELTKKHVRWQWTETHEQALNLLKKSLTSEAMGYFRKDWKTEIIVDASPVGLAAVMAQYNPDDRDDRKVIMYVSRALSDVEKRYAQIEKEALALVWAVERLHLYLYGNDFSVVTDNKAVELIFGNPRSKPKTRIERWYLRLMPYIFTVTHRPGANNIADYFSRNPVDGENLEVLEAVAEDYVNFLVEKSVPRAITRTRLLAETNADPVLIQLRKVITGQVHTSSDEIVPFLKLIPNLSLTSDGKILYGNRPVIPKSLVKEVVKIVHKGHLGITKSKQLIRQHVWFPQLDQIVETEVTKCRLCQANSSKPN